MQTTTMRGIPAAQSSVDERADFITRTYNTLFLSILGFAGIEFALFQSGYAEPIAMAIGSNWLIAMGGLMIVSYFGSKVAMTTTSQGKSYAALVALVGAEAIFFVPLLFMAELKAPGAISSAGTVTMVAFAGLTAIAWTSKKDFSFMGGILKWIGIMALVLILASFLFGFVLGTLFSVAMVAYAGGIILYETSNVLRHYPTDRHVGAAMSLFASVALMFWYVLRLMTSRD